MNKTIRKNLICILSAIVFLAGVITPAFAQLDDEGLLNYFNARSNFLSFQSEFFINKIISDFETVLNDHKMHEEDILTDIALKTELLIDKYKTKCSIRVDYVDKTMGDLFTNSDKNAVILYYPEGGICYIQSPEGNVFFSEAGDIVSYGDNSGVVFSIQKDRLSSTQSINYKDTEGNLYSRENSNFKISIDDSFLTSLDGKEYIIQLVLESDSPESENCRQIVKRENKYFIFDKISKESNWTFVSIKNKELNPEMDLFFYATGSFLKFDHDASIEFNLNEPYRVMTDGKYFKGKQIIGYDMIYKDYLNDDELKYGEVTRIYDIVIDSKNKSTNRIVEDVSCDLKLKYENILEYQSEIFYYPVVSYCPVPNTIIEFNNKSFTSSGYYIGISDARSELLTIKKIGYKSVSAELELQQTKFDFFESELVFDDIEPRSLDIKVNGNYPVFVSTPYLLEKQIGEGSCSFSYRGNYPLGLRIGGTDDYDNMKIEDEIVIPAGETVTKEYFFDWEPRYVDISLNESLTITVEGKHFPKKEFKGGKAEFTYNGNSPVIVSFGDTLGDSYIPQTHTIYLEPNETFRKKYKLKLNWDKYVFTDRHMLGFAIAFPTANILNFDGAVAESGEYKGVKYAFSGSDSSGFGSYFGAAYYFDSTTIDTDGDLIDISYSPFYLAIGAHSSLFVNRLCADFTFGVAGMLGEHIFGVGPEAGIDGIFMLGKSLGFITSIKGNYLFGTTRSYSETSDDEDEDLKSSGLGFEMVFGLQLFR